MKNYNNNELPKFLTDDLNLMYFKKRRSNEIYYIDYYIPNDSVHMSFVYNNIKDRNLDFNLIYEK
jgi:hypothetical protein